MFSEKEPEQSLKAFEVDRLLKLLTIAAKKDHAGRFTILSLSTGYVVAFGTPDMESAFGWTQIAHLQSCPTLKEAIVRALVSNQSFYNGPSGCDLCDDDNPVEFFDGAYTHFDLTGKYAQICSNKRYG